MIRPLAVSAVNKRISERVYEQARLGRYVLTLGTIGYREQWDKTIFSSFFLTTTPHPDVV